MQLNEKAIDESIYSNLRHIPSISRSYMELQLLAFQKPQFHDPSSVDNAMEIQKFEYLVKDLLTRTCKTIIRTQRKDRNKN